MIRLLKYAVYFVLLIVGASLIFLVVISLADFRPDDQMPGDVKGKAEGRIRTDNIFTIETWNIGYFGLGGECDFFYDGGKMTRPEQHYYRQCAGNALKYLENSTRPDFYFFQEVDLDSKRSYGENQADRLLEIFSGYQSCGALNYRIFFVPMPLTEPLGKVKSGILTLSAYPSLENTRYAFPGGFSWPVCLFMLDRCFLLTRVKLPAGKDLVLINTHNEAYDDGSLRRNQMAVLKRTMLREFEQGNYVVAGGDWNQNPLGFDPEDLISGDLSKIVEPAIEPDFLSGGWKWAFDPAVPTNRNVDQTYQKGVTPATIIDFFVVSPNISILDIKTEDLGFHWSDHNPVRMRFGLQ